MMPTLDEVRARLTTMQALRRATREEDAALICPHCAAGHPHRRMAKDSISGPRELTVYDLHERPNVGGAELVECWAAAIWEKIAEESDA